MSNIVSIKKLLDSPRKATFWVFLQSDGASGELTDYTIINPAVDLVPPMGVGMKLMVSYLWHSLAGFDIRLEFDSSGAATDYPVWVMPAGTTQSKVDLYSFGGVLDSSGIDATGKLMITTSGFTTTADQGSFVVQVIKHPHKYVAP